MRVQRSLAVGTIASLALIFLALCALGAQALSKEHSPSAATLISTPVSTPIAPPDDELPSGPIFASPLFVAVLWPVAFVVLEVTLNTLASANAVRAIGSRRFRVWHIDGGDRVETSPVDVEWLRTQPGDREILDIEILTGGAFESFLFGLDLCIGALCTDLAIIYAVVGSGIVEAAPQLVTTTVSVFVLHFIMATGTIFILRVWGNHENKLKRVAAMLGANALGLIAIFSSFLILGNLIAK